MIDPLAAPLALRAFHRPEAASLVAALPPGFEVFERDDPPDDQDGFYLWAVDDHLEVRRGSGTEGVWITLAELSRRAAQGAELLRACGAGPGVRVLDAMSGWGVDGLVLARRQCRVTMIEHQPLLVALQQDLVRRAAAEAVTCLAGDGYRALAQASECDVVYLDPMFPERRKGALPGKRMQWLAELTRPDPRPLTDWLDAARACAGQRVVLKRRRRDPLVIPPDWQIFGRTVRYDVYRGR